MERFHSPLGVVELTSEREAHIFTFHPDIRPYRKRFAKCLAAPAIIRRSKFDEKAFILYGLLSVNKYLAIVIKTNDRNFVLTAYRTDRIQHQSL